MRAVLAFAVAVVAWPAFADVPITGKLAKFDVAGRITALTENKDRKLCDLSKFDMAEVKRLTSIAKSEGGESLAVMELAKKNVIFRHPDKEPFCRQLYVDAGSWSMMLPAKASKKELNDLKLLAAIENNDCEDTAIDAKAKYAYVLSDEIQSIHGFSDEVVDAVNEGYEYGTSNLKAHCPVIRKFADSLNTGE